MTRVTEAIGPPTFDASNHWSNSETDPNAQVQTRGGAVFRTEINVDDAEALG